MIHAILAWLVNFIVTFISGAGYFGVWLLSVIDAFNLPLPSEVVLGFTGFLVSGGRFDFWLVVLAATTGNLAGSILSYGLGVVGGRPFIKKYGKWILFSQRDLAAADRLFKKFGGTITFFARFIPLLRAIVSLPAGITRMPFIKFVIYTFLGSLIWSALLIFIGFKVGENYLLLVERFRVFEDFIAVALLLGIIAWVLRFVRHVRLDKKEARQKLSDPERQGR